MQDLRSRHEKLLLDAADCEMIGALGTDAGKRELFRRLANDLKQLAADLPRGDRAPRESRHIGCRVAQSWSARRSRSGPPALSKVGIRIRAAFSEFSLSGAPA